MDSSINEYYLNKELLTPLQHNIIKILQEDGPKTRIELVNQLHIPRTTIYENLLKLHRRKILEKFSKFNGKRGRPLVFWELNNHDLKDVDL